MNINNMNIGTNNIIFTIYNKINNYPNIPIHILFNKFVKHLGLIS